MAEPKIKYQFGLKSLDMDSYIRNIGNNVRSYIDYNRKHRGWTDDQVNEFSQSYDRYLKAMQDQLKGNTNRFSTNDLGDIIDSQGEFSNTDLGASGQPEEFYYNGKGERIDQATYDALKDRKKKKYTTFNANREVAEFFRRVGTKMSEYKEPPKEKFDVNKHGFVAWWNKKYNPSGEEAFIEPYLELDPVGADGKRPVTNRAKKAAGWLNEYLESMADSDLDFSEYAINNLEEYLNRGRELATEWGNGNWNPEDLIKALEYGIGSNFSKEFFSTEKDPRLSPEQRQALAEQEALQQLQAQQQQQLALQNQQNADIQNWIQEQINKYNDTEGLSVDVQRDGSYLISTDTPLQEYHLPADIDPFANPNYDQYANDFQLSLDENGNYVFPENGYQNSLQSIHSDDYDYNGQHYASPYNIRSGNGYDSNKLMALLRSRALNIGQLERDRSYNKYTAKALVANMLGGPDPYGQVIIGDENNPYNGMIYIPNEYIEEALNRALIFDPNTKTFKYVFVGYIPTIWEDRKALKLREMGINPNALNPSDFAFLIPQHKEGGTIKTVVKAQNGLTLSQASIDRINKRNSDYANTFATTREDIINKNVNASGLSREAYMRHKRPVSKGLFKDAHDDLFNELEGGFTSRDQWQLANIGADIVSMLAAFAPGYGTLVSAGTGAASTVSQYIHDLTGGENFWSSTGNMLVGLGLDAVGLVPGFGASSKGAKIAKNLLKYVPRLAVAVSSYEGLKNAPQIMASLKKAKNDEDLTVDDWRNISQAIGLVTGLGGGAVRRINTRHVATHLDENSKLLPSGRVRNLVRKPTDTGDIAVQLRNKKTGIVETKRYTGALAEALAKASPEDMRKIIFEGKPALGDYELLTATTIRPHLRWGWPPTYHPERARAMAVQRSATGQEYAETKGWFNEDVSPRTELMGEAAYRRAVTENPEIQNLTRASNAYEKTLQHKGERIAKADKDIADIRTKATDYQRDNGLTGGIAEIDRQLTTINAQRRGAVGAKKDALFKQKKQDLVDLEGKLTTKQTEVNTILASGSRKGLKKAQQELDDLTRQFNETKKWIEEHDNTVIKGLNKHKKELQGYEDQIGLLGKKKKALENITDQGHTVAFTNLRAKAVDGKLKFTDPMDPTYTIERQFDDLIKELGIKYKEGGKFQSGGPIRDVTSKADWFTNMYSSDEMKNWLNTFDTSNYQKFNHLLTTWKQNLTSSGYTPGGQAMYNSGVLVRQPQWNLTGTNAVIGRLNQSGVMVGHGGTSDNEAGNYTDGYFGSQEYLRHGGSHDSWNGHSTELNALKEQFKAKGLEYFEDTDGMFKLRPINEPATVDPAATTATQPLNHEDVETKPSVNRQRLTQYMDPKWLALGQTLYANAVNDRMTERALESNKPVLYDFKNDTRYLQGDLDAEMQGERAAGQLMHIASQPITSDGALQQATMLDAAAKAEEYRIQGRTTNNTALRKRAQEILEQRISDHAFNYDVAMKNRLALYQTAANRTTLLNARDAKNYDNQKTLFDEIMYDVKTDWNKRKALQESLDKADIHSRVLDNLEQYVPDLTEEEKAVWEKIRTGQATPSQLQGSESIAYRSALKKASQAETNQLRILYGISPVDYSSSTVEDPIKISKQGGVLISGDGSKIRIAKIRAESRERIKDADRAYRTAKDRHDRTDKNIARADKKMYPLNKPISSRKKK